MSRLRNSAIDDDDETGIDISPLIDCIFILLIFFIVTTTFVEEDGLEVSKPDAAAALPSDESTSVVFEVLEGLTPGEKVITSSYDNFEDMDKLILK